MSGALDKARADGWKPDKVSDLVEAALWVAAIDAVPVEDHVETVARWMRAVNALDLWRLVAKP